MADRENTDLKIEVTAASLEQEPVLANLLELYLHDFSDFHDLEIGPDGRFGNQYLDLYWTDPRRFPFLIYVNLKLAGFVLVQSISQSDAAKWDVAEFFVMRGFRRRATGTRAALDVFARFPGPWQVRVMQSNAPACAFWSRAVHAFAGDAVRLDYATAHGKEWNVFSFHSPPAG